MALTGGTGLDKDEIKGIVLNYRQQDPYTGNYFLGAVTKMDPKMGSRVDIGFHPLLAQSREESRKVVPLKPKESNITRFPKGSIEKHFNIYKVFPDNWGNAPESVRETDYGAVIGMLREDIKLKEQKLDQTEKRLEGMKEEMAEGDLSEEKREKLLEEFDEILGTVKRNRADRRARKE